ncbi:MAG TPA: serine hydrolase [Chitinophagaceae bacterium]|nr:serine hydrolase [Chitinophagaceae bacterium]
MRKVLLSFLLGGLFLNVYAQKDIRSAQLDSLFTSLYKQQKFFGNVLIAEKGKVLYQGSFGKANEETGADLNAESIFELASVSKQFTAMGIMLLKKEGKLSYDDSLRHFFPELPYPNITVRQLLHHTSGLPDYMNLMMGNCQPGKYATNADMIAMLAKYKLRADFNPGERWAYSNTGYAILASIIEKVSGKTYPEFLEKNIFKPLDMKRTLVYRRRFEKRKLDNYAYGYGPLSSTKKYLLPDDDSAVSKLVTCLDGIMGDGTVNSTTNDLLKWDRALYTEKLVSKEMRDEAFEPGVLKSGVRTTYGFGWGTTTLETIGRVLNHTGGWPGYNTIIERHLDSEKVIIILRNHETEVQMLQKIRNILYGLKVEPKMIQPKNEEPKKEIAAAIPDSLKQYIGEYELDPTFIISIFVEDNILFGQATGQRKFPLFKEKDDLYFLKVVEAKIKFVRDEKGVVRSLILYQNGVELPGPKIK